jgi:endo-alpha-1,4-polygalactosaminidase (GH114 family)
MTKRRIVHRRATFEWIGEYVVEYWSTNWQTWMPEKSCFTKLGAKVFLGRVRNFPPNYRYEKVID